MKAVKITLEISHSTIVEMALAFKQFIDKSRPLPPEMCEMVTLLMKLEKMNGKTTRLNQGRKLRIRWLLRCMAKRSCSNA